MSPWVGDRGVGDIGTSYPAGSGWDNMGMLSNRAGRDLNKIYIIHFYIWFLLHVSNNMALRKQFGLIRMSGHFCDKDMPSNYPVSGIIYRACEV